MPTPVAYPSSHTDVFALTSRNYWWVSCVCGLYFVVGFVLWGGTRAAIVSSAVFLVTAVAGLVVHYCAPRMTRFWRSALIVGSVFVGQAVVTWQQAYLPLGDYTRTGNPAERDFIIYLVSSLAVGTMGMFGRAWGAAIGLSMHYAFIFDSHEPFSFKWVYPPLIALVGIVVSSAFWRLGEAYAQLETLANCDYLTGLFNRHRLPREFERLQTLARGGNKSLLLIAWDLDGLKRINDTQGHNAGDAYIRDFAETLQATVCRPTDAPISDAAFRIGGDEFISLHLDTPDGTAILERVHRSCSSVSAGQVRCEQLTLDQALTQADMALYANKVRRRQPRAIT